jgi:hypothetical protein
LATFLRFVVRVAATESIEDLRRDGEHTRLLYNLIAIVLVIFIVVTVVVVAGVSQPWPMGAGELR